MSTTAPTELVQAFRALAEVVYVGETHEAVHQQLCDAAVRLIEGCDHASLMVRRHDRVHTAAATDTVAKTCDELEIELGQGPCIDALDDDKPDLHFCADLRDGCEWPELAARLRGDLGVRGMAGLRIRGDDGRKVGALNLFSSGDVPLSQASLDQAALLTAFASVAVMALERGEASRTLRQGLESNREIGKAVGLLMGTHDIGSDEAFGLLSRVSQEMNVKVAEVAAQLISKHEAQGVS